ncbi:ubiquitin-protein transferase [Aureococcus anophagefferens]|nr:ubiquitin-protein transferase [Aureococcus anophagefferens]
MRTALRRLAVLAALARGERRGFITMTVQRTGSTWLSDELDAHPCITSGKEIFLNEKTGDPPWVWSDAKKRLALEALFDGKASLNFSATRSFEKFLGRCAGARGDVACGFKWMMSQHVDRAWDAGWLPELCAARKLRVVFLERLNLLRVHASTVAKNLASTSAGGHRNPTGEAPREAYIELASGDALVAKLEGIAAQYDGLRRAKPRAASGGAKKQDGRGERSRVSRRVIADDDDDDDETNVWEAEIESAVEFFRSVRGAVVDEREAAVLRHGAEEYLKDGGDAEFLTDYLASAFYVGRDDADVEEDRISRTIANLKAKAESGVAENQDVAGLRRVASDLGEEPGGAPPGDGLRRRGRSFGARDRQAVQGAESASERSASTTPDDAAADPDDDDDDDEASYCGAYDDDDDDYVTLEDLEEFDGFLEAIASLSGPADPPAVDAAILAGIERATSLGWDVDTLTVGGDGVLHVAAEHGRADFARALVGDWGASVDLGNAAERTALHVAAEGNFVPVMLALVAGGADVDALDDEGSAPAHAAPRRTAALEFLADRGLLYDADREPPLPRRRGREPERRRRGAPALGAADLDDAIAYATRAEDRARARGPDGDRRRRRRLLETRRAQLTLMVEGVAFELSWVAIVAGLGTRWAIRRVRAGFDTAAAADAARELASEMDAPPPDALRLADASARSARAEAEAAARECAEIQASRTATHKEKWQAKKRARVAKEEAAKRQANQERAEALARVEARKAEAERLEALRKKASAEARARDEAKARAEWEREEAQWRSEEARAEARAVVRAREAEAERLEAARKLAAEIVAREEAEARQKAVEARAREEAEARARAEAERALVVETLAGLGLASYLPLFREQEIDDGALLGLEADDLSDMGVAPAAALRILSAINAQRMAASKLAVNEVMDDSARHQAVLEAELKDHRARIAKLQLADVPEDLLCCISCEIMKDPVSADDGNTYERVCIEQWFATGKRTSPRTNEPLESLKLRPNHAIRRLTATYLESRGRAI